MSEGLFQLGISVHQLNHSLQRLRDQRMMPERVKDRLLQLYLTELGIIHPSGQNYWRLVDVARLETLLDLVQQQLQQQVIGRSAILRRLEQVHHKSASAWRGNSKAGQGQALREGQSITHDDVLRVRSQKSGMVLNFIQDGQERSLSSDDDSALRSECCLPERLLLTLSSVTASTAKLIMTVENLGAYVDMPLVDGLILVFAPGQNYISACQWINRCGQNIPWVHFPDIDPNGLRMSQQIALVLDRPCHIWLPDFWHTAHQVNDLMGADKYGWIDAPDCAPLTGLREEQRWIEQEVLVLDYRISAALNKLIDCPDDEITEIKIKDKALQEVNNS
ncbi:DUF2220 family protein [Hafnia alvei]|uniref:DUF2220 family protein n=1 Tax=Hafnia alvei TaxID=569 RepID=UPI000DFAD7BF|nr:DUF2220 family protein [Hafnia alvei]TBM12769.1 hypothetical protein EYY84_12885 [Hafnia alvei]STQ68695.1 Uncharacterised protein [Hafnia alvei]